MPGPTKIGVYEIVAKLGEGGMGEVYRARDTKLGRDVALKILPEAFATDPDRLARFQREAQVLASLNHPHIAAIYGLETGQVGRVGQAGTDTGLIPPASPALPGPPALPAPPASPIIVMELVEGPTLADRIAQGSIPIDEALRIATEMAEALEAAHEAGIVHRDLKPANVKVRPDGTVKVLDFGLAKAVEGAGEAGKAGGTGRDSSQSPTLTSPALMTGAGLILGTAAYMAPEQARGHRVDKRADVWAFGAVLFEMLTGRRAFSATKSSTPTRGSSMPIGESVADTLAAVLRADPDWKQLPPSTPSAIRRLLRRSLQKDVRLRLSDMAMVLLELHEAGDPGAEAAWAGSTATPAKRTLVQRAVPIAAVVATAIATAAIVWRVRTPIEETRPIVRYSIDLPDHMQMSAPNRNQVAISPDGQRVAYSANERLYLRGLDQIEAEAVSGTEAGGQGGYARLPFFSPDGAWIGFWQMGALKKMPVAGGTPTTICEVVLPPATVSWETDDEILVSVPALGVFRVAAAGGTPDLLIPREGQESITSARMLPGGQWTLFVRHTGSTGVDQGDVVVKARSTAERRVILTGARDARYVPTGHLIFGRGNALFGQPFDAKSLTLTGTPVPLTEGIATAALATAPMMNFSISSNGTLFYLPGTGAGVPVKSNIVEIAKDGSRSVLAEVSGLVWYPRVSPDGTRLAYGLSNSPDLNESSDLWVMDLARGARTRVTLSGNNRFYPIWTRDGTRLTYADGAALTNQVLWTAADGTGRPEVLMKESTRRYPTSWSPDGHALAYYAGGANAAPNGVGSRDIWMLRLDGDKRTEAPFIEGPFEERGAIFSPNGRWVAYVSTRSGQNDIYARPFTGGGAEITVSVGGGSEPVWGPSGGELFYRQSGQLWSVTVTETTTSLNVAAPRRVFEDPYRIDTGGTQGGMANYDILPGGQRFVMVEELRQASGAEPPTVHMQVILNWLDGVKRRAPIK